MLCSNCRVAVKRSGDGWSHENGLVSCRPRATHAEPDLSTGSLKELDPFQDDAYKGYMETVSEPCWSEFWKFSGFLSGNYPMAARVHRMVSR